MLNRIGQYINGYTRCLIYKSIIAPHFDYCATILVGAQKSEIKKLQIQQNRAMRVIIQCNRYTPVVDMLDTLKFMSIKERIQYKTLIFIFKLIKNQITGDLVNKIQRVKDKTARETRQAQHLVINFSKTEQAKNRLFDKGIELYNKLPLEIKNCEQIKEFKRKIIKHIKVENSFCK